MPTPTFIAPMLAKLVRELPEGPGWEYELKLDGYRLQAIKDGDKVRLYSRRDNDFTRKFAKIATWVSEIKATSVTLDGEAVVVDENGNHPFTRCHAHALAVHVSLWLLYSSGNSATHLAN